MSEAQLHALIELMGGRMSPLMREAMHAVLINGEEQKAAALRIGVSRAALCERVKLARKKLRLAYKAIPGMEYEQ